MSVHHSAVLDTPRPDHWDLSGACRTADPELFFAERGSQGRVQQVRDAKAVCGRCDVREVCFAYAMSRPDIDGVLGGTTEKERHVMRSRAKRAAAVRPISELLDDVIEEVAPPHPPIVDAAERARLDGLSLSELLAEVIESLAGQFPAGPDEREAP